MNSEFWRAAMIRAVRTVAQTAIATIGSSTVVESVKWPTVLSASALAGILSILTSIATGLPETETEEIEVIYREVNENGVPTDGHYVTVLNREEDES